MPQMAPMNWFILFIIFSFIFIMFNLFNYFHYLPMNLNLKNSYKFYIKKMNWKW